MCEDLGLVNQGGCRRRVLVGCGCRRQRMGGDRRGLAETAPFPGENKRVSVEGTNGDTSAGRAASVPTYGCDLTKKIDLQVNK